MAGTAYPALLRFPVFPATLSAKSLLFNRILVKIARRYLYMKIALKTLARRTKEQKLAEKLRI